MTNEILNNIVVPEVLIGNKSATLNGMGYVFYTLSPIGEQFVRDECRPGQKLIEIGAGYNNIPIEALKAGVSDYTAIDLSSQHLEILVKRIEDELGKDSLSSITFIAGKAPACLPEAVGQYDAILADKVIHFFTPDEIIQFVNWVKKALKKDGKLYLTAASPYSKIYHRLLPGYLENLKKGIDFPGHFKNVMENVDLELTRNRPNYKVPSEMVFFARADLIKLIEDNGMKVLTSVSCNIPDETSDDWNICTDNESGLAGIVAAKP